MKDIRVRYAPSPTGYLHIGNARTALFNYLFAKKYAGKFIIRIEDTDFERNVENGVESQLVNLKWLGIDWDESVDVGGEYGPYSQLERNNQGLYQSFIDKLLETKQAYRCFCTKEELEQEAQKQKDAGKIVKYSGKCRCLSEEEIEKNLEENKPYTIRFLVPDNHSIVWEDLVKGRIEFNSNDVSGDFNIVKSNGIPTYNFAVVIDDYLMKMTHILRGEDHISNTPKQILIYEALNLEIPIFGHMSLIGNKEGKKLSKRDTSIVQFIEEYKNLGYLSEALFNFITLLGWSPVGEEEIFSKIELINQFDEKRLSKSMAKFDVDKLNWINSVYIKKMTNEDYLSFIKPYIPNSLLSLNEEQQNKILLLFKEQISYGSQITELIDEFMMNDIQEESLLFIRENDVKNTVEIFFDKIKNNDFNSIEDIKNIIKEVGKEADAKGKMLFMPIRILISGKMHGPEIPEIIDILGKEEIIKIMEKNIVNF